jgi:O-antigen/teichoic acid export membrane protein
VHGSFNGERTVDAVDAAQEPVAASSYSTRKMKGILARNGWLFADQALVSGCNFLTTAVLARGLGVHAFGIFSVLYIVLLYLSAIQLSLIVSPMMTLAPQMEDHAARNRFLRGMATCQYLFSLACCGLALLYLLLQRLQIVPQRAEAGSLLAFTLTILCFQGQDWLRRFWYTSERGRAVFLNDVLSYMGQLIVLVVLWRVHRLTVESAFYAIALTSLVAFIAGALREPVWGNLSAAAEAARKGWRIGRSILVANQFQWLGSQGILLIVAAMVGVSDASGMRAALTLVGPVNVFYQLLDNVIPVRAAKAYRAGGREGLVAYLRRIGLVMVAIIGIPLLLVAVLARPAMILAFGQAFSPFAHLVLWQVVYAMLTLVYRGLQYYHRTMGTVGVLAQSALLVSIVSVASCLLLSRRYGADGGMAALVVGQILNVLLPLWTARRRESCTE